MPEKLHYYLYLARPPCTSCQPDGFDIDSREVWLPGRVIEGFHVLGRCGWPNRLSPRDIWHYSLRPECELDRAWLVFWDYEKDEFSAWLYDNYMEYPDILRDADDNFAQATLVLKKAGISALSLSSYYS